MDCFAAGWLASSSHGVPDGLQVRDGRVRRSCRLRDHPRRGLAGHDRPGGHVRVPPPAVRAEAVVPPHECPHPRHVALALRFLAIAGRPSPARPAVRVDYCGDPDAGGPATAAPGRSGAARPAGPARPATASRPGTGRAAASATSRGPSGPAALHPLDPPGLGRGDHAEDHVHPGHVGPGRPVPGLPGLRGRARSAASRSASAASRAVSCSAIRSRTACVLAMASATSRLTGCPRSRPPTARRASRPVPCRCVRRAPGAPAARARLAPPEDPPAAPADRGPGPVSCSSSAHHVATIALITPPRGTRRRSPTTRRRARHPQAAVPAGPARCRPAGGASRPPGPGGRRRAPPAARRASRARRPCRGTGPGPTLKNPHKDMRSGTSERTLR